MQVDTKYIVSVVELQQEGRHFSLSKGDLTTISTYIKETAAAFAQIVPASESVHEKITEKKERAVGVLHPVRVLHPVATKGCDARPYTTTSSTRAAKQKKTE